MNRVAMDFYIVGTCFVSVQLVPLNNSKVSSHSTKQLATTLFRRPNIEFETVSIAFWKRTKIEVPYFTGHLSCCVPYVYLHNTWRLSVGRLLSDSILPSCGYLNQLRWLKVTNSKFTSTSSSCNVTMYQRSRLAFVFWKASLPQLFFETLCHLVTQVWQK